VSSERSDLDGDHDRDFELFDGDDPPEVEFDREPRQQASWLRLRWVLVAFVVLVVAGLTVGILVFNAAAPQIARGARTPAAASHQFLAALNAGDGPGAANISCAEFADSARAAARSGSSPDVSFALVGVTARGSDYATAEFAQHRKIGGVFHNVPYRVSLRRGDKRWLVCGRAR
jgi:hypothetical protein